MSASYTKRLNEKYELKTEQMKKENAKTICVVHTISAIATCGLAFGTVLLLQNDKESCGNLRITLWLMLLMYATNILESLGELTHLEGCCTSGLCGIIFFVIEVGVIVYMQVVFYTSTECAQAGQAPSLYWWLLVNIIVYFGFMFASIYFKIKACCATVDKKEVQEEVDQDTKEILKEAKEHSPNTVN
jgi:high-affinity K+ transport system ATPase subunit B